MGCDVKPDIKIGANKPCYHCKFRRQIRSRCNTGLNEIICTNPPPNIVHSTEIGNAGDTVVIYPTNATYPNRFNPDDVISCANCRYTYKGEPVKDDFLRIARHFAIPKTIQQVGIRMLQKILAHPSPNDSRSMRSVTSAHLWAGGIIYLLIHRSGLFLKRQEMFQYIGATAKQINKYERRLIRQYTPDIESLIPPSSKCLWSPSNVLQRNFKDVKKNFREFLDASNLDLVVSVVKAVELEMQGMGVMSLFAAGVFFISALQSLPCDARKLCKVARISAITLKATIDRIAAHFGVFCPMTPREKLLIRSRQQQRRSEYRNTIYEWFQQHYPQAIKEDFFITNCLSQISPEHHAGKLILVAPTPAFQTIGKMNGKSLSTI